VEATFQGRQTLTITDANGHLFPVYGEKLNRDTAVLVHGIGCWSYNWRHSIESLAPYFRVICFDAGYGFSGKPCIQRNTTIKLLN